MITYNFDEVIDRRGTNAYKLERCTEVFGTDNLLPLWVADMDFRTPDFIFDAIRERCEHQILGYTILPHDFFDDFIIWVQTHHGWQLQREWIGFLSGIVSGLAFAVNAFTHVGDEIIVQPPIYPPFLHVPENNARSVVCNPLKETNGLFEMDFDDLERKITPKTKMLLLCNPHNPGGRVWSKETLSRLASICNEHKILVVSDEIHADMVLAGHKHVPFALVSDEAAQNSVTYMAPSKTFNIPGMISSSYIIPNTQLRQTFADFLKKSELCAPNLLSIAITQAAYKKGNKWRLQMLEYVQNNFRFVIDYLKIHLPKVKPMVPQASFLLWLDFSAYGFTSEELQHKMVYEAHLGLNQGTSYGQGGEQHLRLNVACSRSILQEAMNRMSKVFNF